jgi:hypothetical protein
MSRPKRSVRWLVMHKDAHGEGACWWSSSLRKWLTHEEGRASGHGWANCARATSRRQAERIAARMPDPTCARLTMRCSRKSKKWPKGFEKVYTWGTA